MSSNPFFNQIILSQPPIGRLHIRRDRKHDNTTVVEHVRLQNGADIRAEQPAIQYASVTVVGGPPALGTIEMPMNGILVLTVSGAGGNAATVTINNPYVSGTGYPMVVLSQPSAAGAAILTSPNPGQIVLTIATGTNNGIYIISVGPNSVPVTPLSY